MKASPAPRTFNMSTLLPLITSNSPELFGISLLITVHPNGPSFKTIIASLTFRTFFKAVTVSSLPPAICISSSVPTITSQEGSIVCMCLLTSALAIKRDSPSPSPVKPHKTGR